MIDPNQNSQSCSGTCTGSCTPAPSYLEREERLAAAEARAEEATRERDEARDQNAAIKELYVVPGKLDAVVAGDFAKFFSVAITEYFVSLGAENYVEMGVNSSDGKDQFAVTVQRVAGKSPHVLRREAQSERDALASRLARAEEALRHATRELQYIADDDPCHRLHQTEEGLACIRLAESLLGPMRDWPEEPNATVSTGFRVWKLRATLAPGEKEGNRG